MRSWLASRCHDALKGGCPLCKAPATPAEVLPLWPADASDFHQYVAAHHTDVRDPEQPVLEAACDLVTAMQSYAMAAHGLRAAPMGRVQLRVTEALRRNAVCDTKAAEAMQRVLDALHDMVTHVEGVSLTLAKAYTQTQQHAVRNREAEDALREARRALDDEARAVRKDRHAVRQRQKHAARDAAAVEERAEALAAREAALEREHDAAQTRMQDAVASAKAASVEAVRRAALREEAAEKREAEAAARIQQAEEQAADATAALTAIRARNQHMADQMRELQAAVRRAQEKYRAARAQQQSQQSQTEATYRKRLAELEARTSDAEELSSSPARTVKRMRAGGSSSPAPVPPVSGTWGDDDDDDFPMPGGVLAAAPRAPAHAARAPAAAPLRESSTLAWNGPLVLGPRRRPR